MNGNSDLSKFDWTGEDRKQWSYEAIVNSMINDESDVNPLGSRCSKGPLVFAAE